MNNELMRDVNFIRCSTMIAELLMRAELSKALRIDRDRSALLPLIASTTRKCFSTSPIPVMIWGSQWTRRRRWRGISWGSGISPGDYPWLRNIL